MNDYSDAVVEVCHRLYAKGFVAAMDGNVSVRRSDGTFLVTRSAVNKGSVRANDLVELDAQGKALPPDRTPSTEWKMHHFIYTHRPDVAAVVHAHPTYATGFAAARIPLSDPILPEVIVGLGRVPLADYATPSTTEIPDSLAPHVLVADAILLANHGVVAYGRDIFDAYYKLEKVEHAAHIIFVARFLGGEIPLSPAEIEKLQRISGGAYGKSVTGASGVKSPAADQSASASEERTRSTIRQIIQSSMR